MAQKGDKQRMIDAGPEEMWGPFLEDVNNLLIEEKIVRHENDAIKLSELCLRIVSTSYHIINNTFLKLGYFLALTGFRQQGVC